MQTSASARSEDSDEVIHGAVIVAVVPGQPTRVLKEAAHYARLMSAPLVVVHVDVIIVNRGGRSLIVRWLLARDGKNRNGFLRYVAH